MQMLRSTAKLIVIIWINLCLSPTGWAQQPEVEEAEQAVAPDAGGMDLHLEVYINDTSSGMIGAFKQHPDGGLSAMPDERIDPSQNTQAFQAWVDNQPAPPPAAARSSAVGWAVGAAAVAVLVVSAVVFMVVFG